MTTSFVNEITKDLKEKIDTLTTKTQEQPLIHVYEWIRQNTRILLFQEMLSMIPEAKINNGIKQVLTRFVDCFEKTVFEMPYGEYSEKMRSCIFHSEAVCKILFGELAKGGNVQDIIADLSSLLKKLPIPIFLNKMLPDHPLYGTNENLATEKKMKREEREKEIKELFPKSDVRCPKCGKSDDVRFTSIQKRSIDEPADEYWLCVPCNKLFRNL